MIAVLFDDKDITNDDNLMVEKMGPQNN